MYLLIMFLILLGGIAKGQNICKKDICVVEFNASWNESNSVDYLDELTDCGVKRISIDKGDWQKDYNIAGIDSPESRTRDLEEKQRGLASKDRLIDLLKDGEFTLESKEVGKYGRVLGVLLINDLNINNTLVEEGYAVEYWGGKKKK